MRPQALMPLVLSLVLGSGACLTAGCSKDNAVTSTTTETQFTGGDALAPGPFADSSGTGSSIFVAQLTGAEEMPPVTTESRGMLWMRLNEVGDTLLFRLSVRDIDNMEAAVIHLAPKGEYGPDVVLLYPGGPIHGHLSGRFEGSIAANALRGPLAGMTLQDLLDAMEAGNTYANVHTEQNPGGELRGQIAVGGGHGHGDDGQSGEDHQSGNDDGEGKDGGGMGQPGHGGHHH